MKREEIDEKRLFVSLKDRDEREDFLRMQMSSKAYLDWLSSENE